MTGSLDFDILCRNGGFRMVVPDRVKRERAQIMPTQDELDKAGRATFVGVPEHLRRVHNVPDKHWSPKKEDDGIENDEST